MGHGAGDDEEREGVTEVADAGDAPLGGGFEAVRAGEARRQSRREGDGPFACQEQCLVEGESEPGVDD